MAFTALVTGTVLADCASMKLVSLETDTVNGPRQVRQYQDINPKDITVWGIYEDESWKQVSLGSGNIIFDKRTPGLQTVRIRVSGKEAGFQTQVMPLRTLTIAAQPGTVLFKQGQASIRVTQPPAKAAPRRFCSAHTKR